MTVVEPSAVTGLFASCRSAWRWEAQPTYTMPSEQPKIARWRAGEPRPADHNASWGDQIRTWTAEGRTIGRVRVESDPLTEYQQYQHAWTFPANSAAGEVLYLLDAATAAELALPQQDFWVFETDTDNGPGSTDGGGLSVVWLNFRPDGTIIDRVLADPDEAVRLRELLVVARGRARPYKV